MVHCHVKLKAATRPLESILYKWVCIYAHTYTTYYFLIQCPQSEFEIIILIISIISVTWNITQFCNELYFERNELHRKWHCFFVCLHGVTSKSSKIANPEQCCQLGIFVARPGHFPDLELATKLATCLWVGCWRWHQYAVTMKWCENTSRAHVLEQRGLQ